MIWQPNFRYRPRRRRTHDYGHSWIINAPTARPWRSGNQFRSK